MVAIPSSEKIKKLAEIYGIRRNNEKIDTSLGQNIYMVSRLRQLKIEGKPSKKLISAFQRELLGRLPLTV